MFTPLVFTLAFLTADSLQANADPATTSAPARNARTGPPQTNSSASFEIRELAEEWTFHSDEDGLFIRIKSKTGQTEVRPNAFKALRRIRRLVLTSREYLSQGQSSTSFALGIESLSENGIQLEYHMVLGLDDPSSRSDRSKMTIRLRPVTKRNMSKPATAMAVGLQRDSSIMLTLVDMGPQGPNENVVETNTYTYMIPCACDTGEFNQKLLLHYTSSTNMPVPTPQSAEAQINPAWYSKIPKPPTNEEDDSSAIGDPKNPPTREAAMSLLLGTSTFADDAIGDGGDISAQVVAFQVILRDPEAAAAFRWLLQNADTAGRLYALCGLRITDRKTFDQVINTHRTDKTKIQMQSGCEILTVTVAEIVDAKSPCVVVLAPGQSPQDWAKQTKCDGYTYDIIGGGYSWVFSHKNDSTVQSPPTETQPPWYSLIHPRKSDSETKWSGKTKKMSREVAFKTLLRTERFAGTAVGRAGVISAQVIAFRVLMKEPEAIGAFRDLQKRAQKAGQLYALCGLKLLDRTTFGAVIDKYRLDESEVHTLFGCVGAIRQVRNIVERDDKCTIRLEGNQTPDDWMKAHDCEAVFYDIMGGGYPWQFANSERTKPKAP